MSALAFTNTSADYSAKNIKPEWLRVHDAVRTFGISRSGIYELIGENKIRSGVIKKRGALRGIRLVSYDSIADYIEKACAESTGNEEVLS